jgi:hypothetical protein
VAWIAAAACWLIAVIAGSGALWRYSLTPGAQEDPAARWPVESGIARNRSGSTLVMFAHPHCPCTRASLEELAVILARTQGRLEAHVVFFEPADKTPSWPEENSLANAARAIPGVSVRVDVRGVEAQRFNALTSGQTLLYDTQGRIAFSGGITAARAHAGDNPGRSAVISLVNHGTASSKRASVFGCSILGASAPSR